MRLAFVEHLTVSDEAGSLFVSIPVGRKASDFEASFFRPLSSKEVNASLFSFDNNERSTDCAPNSIKGVPDVVDFWLVLFFLARFGVGSVAVVSASANQESKFVILHLRIPLESHRPHEYIVHS